ncbi:SNF2-related protein, partial [Bacteroides fragilis]|uniref:SNF2-related protein n=1 Tax=Bacteroides fragilis TaxID=817 RepID=UPI000AC39D07
YNGSSPNEITRLKKYFDRYHLIFTTYGTMRNNIATLSQYTFECIVLDESQNIKNSESLTFRSAIQLRRKSTLVLQTVLHMPERRILYISGEESARQLKLRADRLTRTSSDCLIVCETSLEQIYVHIKNTRPDLVIIDSIQTISTESIESSPGSIAQVRECSASILRFAKETHTPVLLIGHINKEGSIAGPKVLEHIVDTVLQFEGDQHYMYRILRSIKNRFGSTAELGIYEMRQDGLRQVSNPSELLLSQDHEGMSGVAIASAIEGVRPFLIETQALVSSAVYGNPQRSATGFDIRRMNMLLAVLEKRVGFKLAQKDVFLNIAGGLKVNDPAISFTYSQGWNTLSASDAREIAPGIVRFNTPAEFMPKAGNTLTVRDIIRDQVGLFILESKNITLSRLQMHYMH